MCVRARAKSLNYSINISEKKDAPFTASKVEIRQNEDRSARVNAPTIASTRMLGNAQDSSAA